MVNEEREWGLVGLIISSTYITHTDTHTHMLMRTRRFSPMVGMATMEDRESRWMQNEHSYLGSRFQSSGRERWRRGSRLTHR